MITYELDKSNSEPLYVQIYTRIKEDIEAGAIKADEKLPSKRNFAQNLGVSVITVENAYNQLAAEGYIRSVPQKGYFAEKLGANFAVEKSAEQSRLSAVSQSSDDENKLFPFTIWAKLMREELSNNQVSLLKKPSFEGVYELRAAISRHLKQFRNITASPEQIIIGAGSEYLYMLMNILFGNNYVFAVEEPGYSKIAEIYAAISATVCQRLSSERFDVLLFPLSRCCGAGTSCRSAVGLRGVILRRLLKRPEFLRAFSQAHPARDGRAQPPRPMPA